MLNSLRFRVALPFGLGTLAVVGALALALGTAASRSSLASQGDELRTLARNTATVLADGLHERLREVQLLAAAPPERALRGDDSAWGPVLKRVQAHRTHFSWAGLVGMDGRVRVSTRGLLQGQDVSARPWFQAARSQAHVGDVHAAKLLSQLLPPPTSGEPLRFLDFAAPVPGADGLPVGVLGVHVDWAWAHDVISTLRGDLAREQGVQVFIFDRQGQLIHRPRGHAADASAVALNAVPRDRTQTVRWDDGQSYLSVAWPLPARTPEADMGWTVVVRQPLREALAGATSARNAALAAGALAALAAGALAWVLAGRFAAPLIHVAQAARAVQGGALHTAIPPLRGSRELEALSDALQGMTQSLLQREQQLAAANESLEERVQARTVELLHTQTALQLANEELQALAHRDGLTGLLNRRAGDERLRQEMARHRRSGQPLAVAVADIDHFKAVNDTHGHAAGDEVLRDVAHVLQAACRSTDVLIRMGGEEFVVLMPDTAPEGARVACEKLRIAVAMHRGRVPVTLSLGLAAPAQAYGLADAALAAADKALYVAKQSGRNRVVLADPTDAGGEVAAGQHAMAEMA